LILTHNHNLQVKKVKRDKIKKFIACSLWSVVCLLLCGCVATEYNVATHKQDIFFYSSDKEVNLGRNVSRSINKTSEISKNPQENEKIFTIGRKIADVCDRGEINYYFYIIDEEEKNAFSLPGGYVYIYEGLLEMLDNDDQIAFILAHEVGHIVARHHIKRLQAALGYNLLILASSQIETSGNISQVQGINLILATLLSGYSREDEFLADKLAIKYTKKAGFDPEEGLAVLDKLQEANKKEGPRQISYFRTHPFIPQRIRRIKQTLGLPLEPRDIINY